MIRKVPVMSLEPSAARTLKAKVLEPANAADRCVAIGAFAGGRGEGLQSA